MFSDAYFAVNKDGTMEFRQTGLSTIRTITQSDIPSSLDSDWETKCNILQYYYCVYGHYHIQRDHGLFAWINKQRLLIACGSMSADKLILLHSKGFTSRDVYEAGPKDTLCSFEEHFMQLCLRYKEYGNLTQFISGLPETSRFHDAVKSINKYRSRNTNTETQFPDKIIQILTDMGFPWDETLLQRQNSIEDILVAVSEDQSLNSPISDQESDVADTISKDLGLEVIKNTTPQDKEEVKIISDTIPDHKNAEFLSFEEELGTAMTIQSNPINLEDMTILTFNGQQKHNIVDAEIVYPNDTLDTIPEELLNIFDDDNDDESMSNIESKRKSYEHDPEYIPKKTKKTKKTSNQTENQSKTRRKKRPYTKPEQLLDILRELKQDGQEINKMIRENHRLFHIVYRYRTLNLRGKLDPVFKKELESLGVDLTIRVYNKNSK